MTYDEMKDYLLVSEMCFTCNNADYYVEQTATGYAAAECSENMVLVEYTSFDDLLDNFMIGNKPLRNELVNITDW